MLVRIDFAKLSSDSERFAAISKPFYFDCVLAIQNCYILAKPPSLSENAGYADSVLCGWQYLPPF